MSSVESKKQYVLGYSSAGNRIALSFQFAHNCTATWWHDSENFREHVLRNGKPIEQWTRGVDSWVEAAAVSYEQSAAMLTTAFADTTKIKAIPIITMGELEIEVIPKKNTARLEMTYYNYGEHISVLEAQYSFETPVANLAAAFVEAAATLRAIRK